MFSHILYVCFDGMYMLGESYLSHYHRVMCMFISTFVEYFLSHSVLFGCL